MGHPAKELSPWRRVDLLERAIAGEDLRVLEVEYNVHRATLNRWLAKCRNDWFEDHAAGVGQGLKVAAADKAVHA